MSRFYDRTYELTLSYFTDPDAPAGSAEITNNIIDKLQISGEVQKSIDIEASIRLKIWNLDPEIIGSLTEQDGFIELKVGYAGNNVTIFKGDITGISPKNEDVDIVSTIRCKNGYNTLRDSSVSRIWPKNVKARTIFTDIVVQDLGLAVGDFDNGTLGSEQGLEFVYTSGRTLDTSANSALDNMTRDLGLQWSLQEGEIDISPIGSKRVNLLTNVIGPTNGLIGTPERVLQNTPKRRGSTKKKDGWTFTTFMRPELKPSLSVRVEVEPGEAPLELVLSEVRHVFNFRQNDWKTVCVAKDLDTTGGTSSG